MEELDDFSHNNWLLCFMTETQKDFAGVNMP